MPFLSWSQTFSSKHGSRECIARKSILADRNNDLPGQFHQGMHRVSHAKCLARLHPFLQDRSLHPSPRSTALREAEPLTPVQDGSGSQGLG